MDYDVAFPHLNIYLPHFVNSVTIPGLNFKVMFYGILIGLGMLAGLSVALSDVRRRGQSEDMYLDFIIWGIIFAIVGARLYYVIFSWSDYKDNPLQILNLRGGGLAIYGGVIGGLLTLFIFCRRRKQSFFSMVDSLILGLVTGQIIGRWGNFFNCEAFGSAVPDSFFLGMRIKTSLITDHMMEGVNQAAILVDPRNGFSYVQVHPTFLYESLWNLCLLFFMLWYRTRKKFTGEMLFIYLGGYGLGRALVESLRTDQLKLTVGGIPIAPVSQLVGILCFVISVIVILAGRKRIASASVKTKLQNGGK